MMAPYRVVHGEPSDAGPPPTDVEVVQHVLNLAEQASTVQELDALIAGTQAASDAGDLQKAAGWLIVRAIGRAYDRLERKTAPRSGALEYAALDRREPPLEHGAGVPHVLYRTVPRR